MMVIYTTHIYGVVVKVNKATKAVVHEIIGPGLRM